MRNAKSLLEKFNKLNIKEAAITEAVEIYANLFSVMVGHKNDKTGDSTATIVFDKKSNSFVNKWQNKYLDDIDEVIEYLKEEYGISLSSSEDKKVRDELSELAQRAGMREDNSSVDEGLHYNTKIRQLESTIHPRKIKLAVRESKRMMECLMDDKHPSANPMTEDDMGILKDSKEKMESIIEAMSKVRVGKRKRKNEEDDKDSDFFDDEAEAAADVIPDDEEKNESDQAVRALSQSISKERSKISDIEAKVAKLQDKKKNTSDDKAYDKLHSEIQKLHAEADKHRATIKKLSAEKKKARKK